MVLSRLHGESANARELMDMRAGLASPPAKPIMLTFDGGYRNLCMYAYPALSAANHKFILFLLTGTVDDNNSWDGDNNPAINFLRWDEVTALYAGELIDLESHTVAHPDLTKSTSTARQSELVNSRVDLQSRYGASVDFICYPYGSHNTTVEQACRDACYFGGFAAWGGVETTSADKWALKREPIYWDSIIDYDPNNSGSWFFNQIADPDIKRPNITINSIQHPDPAANSLISNSQPYWG